MNRFRSALRIVAPLALLLATTAVFTSTAARADWEPMGKNEDGSATLWYNEDNGRFVVTIEKDGKFGVYFEEGVIRAMLQKLGFSNPDPNDPNNGKGTDKPDIAAMIKELKDAAAVVHKTPIESKIGGIIEQHGGGKSPHWNPSDDDSNGPKNPPSSKDHKTGLTAEQRASLQKMLNEVARQAALGKVGMYDGSEGGSESAPELNKHSQKNSSNDNNNHENPYKPPNVPKGEELGPRPELVNPNPDLKTGGKASGKSKAQVKITMKNRALAKSGKTDKGASDKGKTNGTVVRTSNVMSPGLLEGGGGFASSGPSAAGNAMRGGSTRAR